METVQASEKPDAELSILESLYDSERRSAPLRQRELASAAGASLGMTNAILKRLAQKGWIVIRRLNSRNVQYAVTPDGVNEIARRSYRYFKRTIRNVVFYRDLIDETVSRAKIRGIEAVLLIGVSDLDFIVEHACVRHGLTFLKAIDLHVAASVRASGVLTVFAEGMASEGKENENGDELYLSTILSGLKEA
jgi:DNA-binding MarR family transcriptional regulator